MKKSTIAERLLQHFANGGELSIYNMRVVWITNPAREVVRNFQNIHSVRLVRTRMTKPTGGYYIVYTLDPKDKDSIVEAWRKSINV